MADRGAITHTLRTELEILKDIHRGAVEIRRLRPLAVPDAVQHEEYRLDRLWEELRAARSFRYTLGRGHHTFEPDRPQRNGHGPKAST